MSVGKLKARADELAREAFLERRRCQEGIGRAVSILQRRAGSPAGLAFSFSLGFVAGTPRSRKARRQRPHRDRGGEQLAGAFAASAVRLLLPMLTNALVPASRDPGGATAAAAARQPAGKSGSSAGMGPDAA